MKNELSPRENELIINIANGLRTKEIAALLGISTKTAQNHREKVTKKIKTILNIKDVGVAEITHFAIARGMIKLRFIPQISTDGEEKLKEMLQLRFDIAMLLKPKIKPTNGA